MVFRRRCIIHRCIHLFRMSGSNNMVCQSITLVKEKVATSPQSVATMVYTWGGRHEFEVRKDQEFSLKPIEQIKYKLVDVQPDKAVIVNTQKPNEPIEIGFAPP